MESLSNVATIDLSLLRQNSENRFQVIKEIREACHACGFFQVVNHGIHDSVLEDAFNVNAKFFEAPLAVKQDLISDDIFKVVRFGRVFAEDSRDFLKLYAHPLQDFISYWPTFPHQYREKMGIYSTEARKLCIELFGAIMESLNLHHTHLQQDFQEGFQIVGINRYPRSASSMKVAIRPHTDHSIITLLVQSGPGLSIIDGRREVDGRREWKSVPELKGSMQVLVGDHLEVISNGFYKSVLHTAFPSCDGERFSIVSLHSLGMDEIVEPAAEVERRKYRGSSLRDYLKYIASKDSGAFIDTIKINDDGDDSLSKSECR